MSEYDKKNGPLTLADNTNTFWKTLASQLAPKKSYPFDLIHAIIRANPTDIVLILTNNASNISKSNETLINLDFFEESLFKKPVKFAINLCSSNDDRVERNERFIVLYLLGKYFNELNELLADYGLPEEEIEQITAFANKTEKPHALDAFIMGTNVSDENKDSFSEAETDSAEAGIDKIDEDEDEFYRHGPSFK